MIEFKPITIKDKSIYEHYLFSGEERGCECSFANLFLWGEQKYALLHDHIVILSRFSRYIYSYPIGTGDKKPVLDAIIADAKERGIPCLISGVLPKEKETLEELYPGMFRFDANRDRHDYIYDINDLADLKGRKYQRKRNHYNRFLDAFPDYAVEPLSTDNLPHVKEMVARWYDARLQENPDSDFQLEQIALAKVLQYFEDMDMEGLVLLDGENVLAVTLGSRLSHNTLDVHFEKARWDVQGAYTAINLEFARYIRNKFPQIQYLNREEDMGLEGLRQAKLSYYPHHMREKSLAIKETNDEN